MDVKLYNVKDLINALMEHYREDETIGAHELESMILDCEAENTFRSGVFWEPTLFKKEEAEYVH